MGDGRDESTLTAPAERARESEEPGPSAPLPVDLPAPPTSESSPPAPARAARSRWKRLLDVGLTLASLPVALPLGLLIALAVACTSRGRVLFFQERVGLGGRRFRLVKFRTMSTDAETLLRSDPELWQRYVENDFKLPAGTDTRVTPVGRFLRRASLDELPQLVNVLRGEMSLVGPRPIVPEEIAKYTSDRAAYLSVKPGITGTWQVNGRSGVGYPDRITLDRDYVDSWTFWLDVRILLRTPRAVLSRRGAH